MRRAKTAKMGPSGSAWRTLFGLLGYPRLFAALAVGAALLTTAVSAYPLFLSSAGSDVVVSEIRRPLVTRYGAGIGYKSTNLDLNDRRHDGRATYEAIDDAFRRLTAESPDLGTPILGALGPTVAASSGHGVADARLMASTDALEHVRPVQGESGSGGVWIPDLVAADIEAKPGDTIMLTSQDGITVPAEVAGLYAGLYSEPRRGYWHQWAGDIYPSRKFCVDPCPDPPVPPQFILMDLHDLREVMDRFDNPTATVAWQAPLRNGVEMTLYRAQRFEAFAERLRLRISEDVTALGRLFDCCQERGVGIITTRETTFYSLMGGIVSRAEQRIAAVAAPGRVLQATTVVVALAVLAAAGLFAVAARPTETRLRFARGASPTVFGVRAGTEAVIPCLVGTGIGFLLALLMVHTLGSGGPIDTSAIAGASVFALGAALSATLAIGLVAMMSFRSTFEAGHGRAVWIGRLPWELLLLGLAWMTFTRLRTQGALESVAGIDRPRSDVLLFPLLFIAGGAALAARGSRLLARTLPTRWSSRPAGMLAIRRLARTSGLAIALVAAAALSLGLLLHSQAVVRSLRETVDTRARIFVGSDVAAYVNDDTAVPEGFPHPATKVTRRGDAGTFAGTEARFDIFAIDADSFAEAAFWQEDFSPVPLEEILERLQERGDRMPVAIAGDAPAMIRSIETAGTSTPVDVVARAAVFPGMLSHRPLVIVDVMALDHAFAVTAHPLHHPEATPKILIRGETREVIDSLSLLSIVPYYTATVDDMKDLPATKALIESLVVLNALGLAAAALVLAGILMYLQARQRGSQVAYGLTVRMGLTPTSYRRSIAAELGGMLALALVAGAFSGIVAAYFVNGFVDPLGYVPLAPLFRPPMLPAFVLAIGLAVVAWTGAWWTARTAAHARFGEVMRVADT